MLLIHLGFAQIKDVTLLDNWSDELINGWYNEGAYNEVWGFVYEGKEYGVIGSANGTNIIKINDDNTLERIQFIEGRHLSAIHRDFHDYNGYLYEVCDQGKSSLRIHDLSYLPDSIHMVYDDSTFLARCHNIFIDSSSALLYACGVTYGTFDVAMRVLSLDNPTQPTLVYDYEFVDYVHDVFVRNDTAYIHAGNQGMRVADFSNPAMPLPLGTLEFYPDKGYNHSGWLSEDGKTYVMCDETAGMRFKVLDVSDLSNIEVLSYDKPPTFDLTMPHNVMVKDGLAYFSYYNDGLQIYDIRNPTNIKRVAYYDTYPDSEINFRGAWGIYAFLPSGRLLVSDRKYGMFLLNYNPPPNLVEAEIDSYFYPNYVENGFAFFYTNQNFPSDYQIEIFANNGSLVKIFYGSGDYLSMDLSDLSNGLYLFKHKELNTDKVNIGKFVVNRNF